MYTNDYKFLLTGVYDSMSTDDDYKFLLKEVYDNMSADDYKFLLKEVYDNMSTDDFFSRLMKEFTALHDSVNFKNQSQRQEGILNNQSQRFMTIFGIMYRYKNAKIL